uniref:Homologous recombination OB-fold protein OB-fold domain-containing protein n=1 Tax=Tetraodon nigroviridis TaxID=99883 RepID=H3CF72_TETNG
IGLDERNPACFLHSYSVVMVLRKAALKQLATNKVPNMAVLLKSIVHTHADARAVFKDPTGEIEGTVHRRLLEERAEELKVGAVLLLKQVGVFSPSHRNHYLNVTPNNLLRIYSPDGASLSSTQPLPLLLADDGSSRGAQEPENRALPNPSWELGQNSHLSQAQAPSAYDDLDELLGQLPEDSY